MAGVSGVRPAAGRARAPRTLVHKLGSIVLAFEALVVLLAGLTIFGLNALPESVPQWWGIAGGGVVAALMLATAGLISRPGAVVFGWLLQALVAASAFFVPAILLVTVIFGGMWGYATIMGARMDARRPQGLDTGSPTESE